MKANSNAPKEEKPLRANLNRQCASRLPRRRKQKKSFAYEFLPPR
jgi:hypothetical protein